MKSIFLFLSIFNLLLIDTIQAQDLFKGVGSVSFISDAQLEKIQATSNSLEGIFNISKNIFAFKINMVSFEGFNSPLQKEHFNEHYLETRKYPISTYTGNIITDLKCPKDCEQEVFSKGKFTIHGVTNIETIKIIYKKSNQKINIKAKFSIVLSDYNIKIPKIVQAKIASEIQIESHIILNVLNE